MPSIKITEEMEEWFSEGEPEEVGFELVKAGDWTSEGKWETKELIYKQLSSGKLYAYWDSRSGSYYSDYEYDSPSVLVEVEPVEVKTIEYKVVK